MCVSLLYKIKLNVGCDHTTNCLLLHLRKKDMLSDVSWINERNFPCWLTAQNVNDDLRLFSFYSFPGKWRQWNIGSLKCILNWNIKLNKYFHTKLNYLYSYTNQFLKYLDVIEDKKDIETYCGMKISLSKERVRNK